MRKLTTYLVRQMLPWLFLGLGGMVLVFLATQLLRVSPIFAGARATPGELVQALALLLVPVVGWALTPAFAVAVFAACGRMAADGELTGLDAAGIGRLRLCSGPILLALVLSVVSAWLWIDAGPAAISGLRRTATRLAGRALASSLSRDSFAEVIPGLVVFCEDPRPGGECRGLLIDDSRDPEQSMQLVANRAKVGFDLSQGTLTAQLSQGTAFLPGAQAGTALSFQRLTLTVPVAGEISRRLDFLPQLLAVPSWRLLEPAPDRVLWRDWRYTLWRRVAGPLGFLAVALCSCVLALVASWRRRGAAVAAAAGLFLGYHLLNRAGESLMSGNVISPFWAAFAPALIVFFGLATYLALQRYRGLGRPGALVL